MDHADLPDGGLIAHHEIDQHLSKLDKVDQLIPVTVTGARDDLEAALASLGLITDSTTAS